MEDCNFTTNGFDLYSGIYMFYDIFDRISYLGDAGYGNGYGNGHGHLITNHLTDYNDGAMFHDNNYSVMKYKR